MRKVSIIPRGMALGVTLSAPDVEKSNYEEHYLLGKIKVALGGRVAEELVYGTITAGAESDIQQLTAIARQMVGRWGMSESIGPIAVLPSESNGPLLPGVSEVSQATQELIDREVRRLVDESHAEVTRLLTEHRGQARRAHRRTARSGDARRGRRLRGRRRGPRRARRRLRPGRDRRVRYPVSARPRCTAVSPRCIRSAASGRSSPSPVR